MYKDMTKKKNNMVKWYAYNREYGKEYQQKQKRIVISHYSNGSMKCACCGESEFKFLTIDHINNDGAKHRREKGLHLYRILIDEGFPNGFQVLCFNCNMGKRVNNGICPHKSGSYKPKFNKKEYMRKYMANKRKNKMRLDGIGSQIEQCPDSIHSNCE